MPDHRSSDSRMPDWAVIPVWSLVLALLVALVFAVVAIGAYYVALS